MTGVRDISLINTPPINRLPVETKLMQRDDEVLKNAILDELARGGQVFVVNDRVQTITKLAEDIEAMAPEAKVAVAHGQMEDHELERVMDAFLSRKFDILVSTSIIESGLDVPNANTIIIMNAHHFGISQLYQMRGRVGRSSVLAKAFLVIPQRGEISQESMRRLKALEQFTDLGSGYQLAMRDLEIRGAGNLLGQEQHGFIAEVGFETYVRLVREAVEMLRGGALEKPIQPRVEIGVDAYLPEDYVEDGLTRISLYAGGCAEHRKRIAGPLWPCADTGKDAFARDRTWTFGRSLAHSGACAPQGRHCCDICRNAVAGPACAW